MRLALDEIQDQIAQRQDAAAVASVERAEAQYTYVRPLLGAANDLIDWMGNPEGRLMFGLPEIDAAIRGIARGELCYLTGRAHSGKTQAVLHSILHNPQLHFLYFTPDEVDNLVLTKLIALMHGINAEALEERIKDKDTKARNLVRQTADAFSNVVVIDQGLTFAEMTVALHEAQDHWGVDCDGVIVDYLDLLPGDADYNGTKGKSNHLKGWVKKNKQACVCIHQPKRGGASRGQRIGMDDMNMGGETEATFVLGVYRKRDDEWLEDWEREQHRNTLSIAIDKNKRPPCHVGTYDYFLDPASGTIRALRPEDMIVPGAPVQTAKDAMAYRRTSKRPSDDDVIDLALRRARQEQT